jgi:hypothetical protein
MDTIFRFMGFGKLTNSVFKWMGGDRMGLHGIDLLTVIKNNSH